MAFEQQLSVTIFDYVIFVILVIFSTSIAVYARYFGAKEKTKSDYVFGSAGASVSMFAMMISLSRNTLGVRSLLGYPAELIYRGSGMWETMYGLVLTFPLVCFVFIPVYYSLGITSVYEYLDLRFKSRLVRCIASATYICRMVLNLGITVFTPCIALKIVIGIPYWASVGGITLITVFFTIMGGLKTAILADVFQGLLMIGVACVIIIRGYFQTDGLSYIFNTNKNNGRLEFLNFTPDLSLRVTTFSAVFGQLFISLSQFGCQQNLVQRYCSMKTEKHIRRTMLWNMPLVIVLFSLFWIMGMVIYSVYVNCDPLASGYINKIDEIVPFFVEDQFTFLPGFLGLVMAALFNGALSLYVSQLSSIATVTWEDFVRHIPVFRDYKDSKQLIMIKVIGAIYGMFIMGITFVVSLMSGVIDSSMMVTSATSGPLLGVFLLAMLVPCANWKGAVIGMLSSHMITLWLAFGGYSIEKAPIKNLPLSITNCTNTTFSQHGFPINENFWMSAPIPIVDNITTPSAIHSDYKNIDLLTQLYSVSYMYYCLIGTVITILFGTIFSIILSSPSDTYPEHLLHPLVLKLSRKCAGKPRQYENSDISNSNNVTDVQSKGENKVYIIDNACEIQKADPTNNFESFKYKKDCF